MSRFLASVSKDAQLLHMSQEPFDLDGARPVPSVLTKTIEEVEEFAQRGFPISLSELVSSLFRDRRVHSSQYHTA
jgi:linoleate 10R-lipoxygenase